MKYIQLLKLELKLLLKDKAIFILLILFILSGCGEKKDVPEKRNSLTDFPPVELQKELNKQTKKNYGFIISSRFINDTSNIIAAGEEISTKEDWGIRFDFYKLVSLKAKLIFSTSLLEGSLNDAIIKPVKLAGHKADLLLYHSGDYFLGTQGGEIFTYLIDAESKKIYYSHLAILHHKPVSLFISNNVKNEEIRQYIINLFKVDYPNLKIVSEDIKLPY